MNENDELLDLVDANGKTIGITRRGDLILRYPSPTGYPRYAVGFLINQKGQIWAPTRSMHKAYAPGALDFSVGEHVLSGETFEIAIRRGFAEETGLAVNANDLKELGIMRPTKDKPSYEMAYAYLGYTSDIDPVYDPNEFVGGQWLTISELKKLLRAGASAKSALLPALQLLMQTLGTDI